MKPRLSVYELLKMLYEEEHKYFVLKENFDKLKEESKLLEQLQNILVNKNEDKIFGNELENIINSLSVENKNGYLEKIRVSFSIIIALEKNSLTRTKDYQKYFDSYNLILLKTKEKLMIILNSMQELRIELLQKTRIDSIFHIITKSLVNDNSLIYNSGITYKEQIQTIYNYLTKKGYNSEEIIALFEEIEKNGYEKYHPQEIFSDNVTKLIQTPYKYSEVPYMEDKESKSKMNGIIDGFYLASKVKLAEFDSIILNFPTYNDIEYSKKEIDYLYLSFINKYIEEIIKLRDQIINLNKYQDANERKFIIMMYNEISTKYEKIKNRYLKIKTKYETEHIEKNIELETEENKKLLYLMVPNGTESYIERDISKGDFSTQYFEKLQSLLEEFKKGTLSPKKYTLFSSNHEKLSGFGRLKDDQVRIMYYPMGNNYYLILGAGIKKDTRDNGLYEMFVNRYKNSGYDMTEESINNSLKEEDKLFDFIGKHSTRGTR